MESGTESDDRIRDLDQMFRPIITCNQESTRVVTDTVDGAERIPLQGK